ncbi:MAG: CPBP family intramembrane metalloprotease [Lachnospiraceae bacterium]|nr:CPBP family intramembrane metalloprotease [Lachnospiraceae bacterium]
MDKKHILFDHTILSYFVFFVLTELCINVFSGIDEFIAGYVEGYGSYLQVNGQKVLYATGVGCALGAIVAVGLFRLWFRPYFKGCFNGSGLKSGLMSMLPVLIISFIGSCISIFQFGSSSIPLSFFHSLAPGFGEEVAFRGIGIANYMRRVRSEKQLYMIFWLSSIVFGLVHLGNIVAGADMFSTLVQSVFAIGIGMLFCAVYLRTGNLWPTVIAHTAIDFVELCRGDLGNSSGLMMDLGPGDYVVMLSALVAGILGIVLFRKKYHPQILKVWQEKWSVTEQSLP